MASQGLPSTSEDILRHCPRFRILVVGKSGVGKSSLINHIFSVDYDTVSHRDHGICDIHTEITSSQNPRFVVHDSQGFEPGAVDNLNIVKSFLEQRASAPLKDRIHAVWLCVQVPYAGGRVFEKGDEELLSLGLKTPIVVVFTQFDRLLTRKEEELTIGETTNKSFREIEELLLQRSNDTFQKSCIDQLDKLGRNLPFAKVSVSRGHGDTLSRLVDVTQELVSRHVEGDVWIVSAMAQRASAQAKIDSSIEVGMKKYWQGLASSTNFSGSTLRECLSAIHTDIISSWNFNDPDKLLISDEFQEKMMKLVQVVMPEPSDLTSWFSQSIGSINNSISVASSFASIIAPPIAAIGLSAMFVKWVAGVYQATPEVLRCLMGYIVDLTLVMDQLFLDILPQKPPRRLSADLIDMALDSYKTSSAESIHDQIREYAKQSTFMRILQSNNAQQKVVEIIRKESPLLQAGGEERADRNAPEPATSNVGSSSGKLQVRNVREEISKDARNSRLKDRSSAVVSTQLKASSDKPPERSALDSDPGKYPPRLDNDIQAKASRAAISSEPKPFRADEELRNTIEGREGHHVEGRCCCTIQ